MDAGGCQYLSTSIFVSLVKNARSLVFEGGLRLLLAYAAAQVRDWFVRGLFAESEIRPLGRNDVINIRSTPPTNLKITDLQ